MLRFVGVLLALFAGLVLAFTGFGWFGASTDSGAGWIGLAFIGLALALADWAPVASRFGRRTG